MAFRMKKSYADKIRREQAKYTVPVIDPFVEDDDPDQAGTVSILVKPAVDGSAVGRADVFTVEAPKTGGMKMRKTSYVFADR